MANKLQEFISEAHKSTYASGKLPRVLKTGGKQFIYKLGGFKYIDTYFGSDNFIGTEVVKEAGKVVWGMSYYGFILGEEVNSKDIFVFLQKMLSKSKPGMLLRGPKSWKQKSWSYRYSYKGSFSNFTAHEVVKYKGRKIYQARFNGGRIKK